MIAGVKKQAPVIRYRGHEPVDPYAARLLHLAFTPDGAVVAQRKGQLLVLLEGSWERSMRVRDCLGWVFQYYPGTRVVEGRVVRSQPTHKIMATLADGFPCSIAVFEMVFNDAGLVDSICGEGTYEKLMAARRESEALLIARRFYAQPNLVVIGGGGSAGKGAREGGLVA